MKYVVYQDGGLDHMVIFPLNINHNQMAEALKCLRFGSDRNWYRNQGEIVSAGFIDGGECHGVSESLGIKSRKDIDTALYKSGGLAKAQSTADKGAL